MLMILVILKQIAIMALLIAAGLLLSRMGYLSERGTRDLGAVLLRAVIPCVIIRSFLTEYSRERLALLGQAALLGLLANIIAMLVSWLAFGRRRPVDSFAAALCNAGFIGFPLVEAVAGEEGVFFVVPFVAMLNLFQWTYGVYVLTGDRRAVSPRTIVKNPVMIAIVIGFALFVTRLPVPDIAVNTVGYLAAMNTPVAMLLLGAYMARLPLRRLLLEKSAYPCAALRLLGIPLLVLLAFRLVPGVDLTVKTCAFLAAATPVGANICVFAQQHGADYEASVITVCLTTLLSVVTVPLLFSVAQMLL